MPRASPCRSSLRDGNSDFGKLQAIAGAIVAKRADAKARCSASVRPSVRWWPQFDVDVDRIKTQTLHVTTDQIFSTLSSYLGSTYVNQFNKFRPHLPGLRPGGCAISADPRATLKT